MADVVEPEVEYFDYQWLQAAGFRPLASVDERIRNEGF
jgi:hypothetical protein